MAVSYLTLNKDVSMNKVTISLWFRVPKESAGTVRELTFGAFRDFRVMYGVIPLITWGNGISVSLAGVESYDSGYVQQGAVVGSPPTPVPLQRLSTGYQSYVSPSYIGVRVGSTDVPWDPPVLDVHIQSNDNALGSGLAQIATGFAHIETVPDTDPPLVLGPFEYSYTDVSSSLTAIPEYLGNSDAASSNSGAGHPEVKLDEWHHLLISWELLPHSNNSGACKMWCAIDDVNKHGNDLPAMNDITVMGPNDHMSWLCFEHQGSDTASVSIEFSDIPSNPVSIPSLALVSFSDPNADGSGVITTKNPIEKVELGELQIFSGVTLDTREETNRRAFIAKDEKGGADGNVTTTYKPEKPSKAKELMGQEPDILLHGSGNWKNGNNTGSLGFTVDQDGNKQKHPSGQFEPTGKIKPYKPEPSLHG